MAVELFNNGTHRVLAYNDLVRGDEGVQANQFLILDGQQSALIDPGGSLLYTPLSLAVGREIVIKNLTYVMASHQDPDIIGSVDRWLMYTNARIVSSRLWGRFIPHSVPSYQANTGLDRYLMVADEGAIIPLGANVIYALPAHFLHSVGNLQFYDPVSKILFSGDLGASMVDDAQLRPVEDFDAHLLSMLGFHRRYMAGNKACRMWARMARSLDLEWIVPQHGRPFRGKAMIDRFIHWIEGLSCGLDLMDENAYQLPRRAAA